MHMIDLKEIRLAKLEGRIAALENRLGGDKTDSVPDAKQDTKTDYSLPATLTIRQLLDGEAQDKNTLVVRKAWHQGFPQEFFYTTNPLPPKPKPKSAEEWMVIKGVKRFTTTEALVITLDPKEFPKDICDDLGLDPRKGMAYIPRQMLSAALTTILRARGEIE